MAQMAGYVQQHVHVFVADYDDLAPATSDSGIGVRMQLDAITLAIGVDRVRRISGHRGAARTL
jgi:hypothetical protein